MLTVTEKAQEQIAKYFEVNEVKPIRIFLTSGCGGRQIALALDMVRPDDRTFEFAGIQYVVEKAFLTEAQPIEVDFAGHGFKVSSSLKLEGGCGGCGSSEGCCT
ncbi:MAG: IscA/HesB family protein [Desulfobacteraceae bacterium]|nr:IscA/HesB family protein [Desulfobacteraceae bacterium]